MAIIVGSVGVDVIPNVKNFSERVRASLIPQADKLGRELGQHLASNFKKVLDVELKDLPKARLELDTKALEASVENARRKVGELSKDTAKPNVKLDTAGFNADASRVELRLKTLQKSSGFAHFGLDSTTFDAKAAAVRLRMQNLDVTKIEPEIKPKIDTASLDLVKAKLDELKQKVYSPNVKINDTQALVRILEIKARLEELGNKLAKPGVDLAGVLRAEAEIEKLNLELDEFGHKHVTAKMDVNTQNASRGIRRLIDLAIAFAPALTTIGIVGVGVAGALASSFAVAASGVGLFALATRGAFALLKTDEQQLKLDEGKLAAARIAVDNAKGPKQRATAMKQWHTENLIVLADLKAMGPAEGKLANTTDKLKEEWKSWLRGTAIPGLNTLLGPLRSEFPKILKDLTPLFNGTVTGLRDLERAGFKALAAPFWQHFFTFLGNNAAPTIRTFGRIIGNVVTGLAGLVEAFTPLARKIDGGLLGITQKFANFGRNAAGGKSDSFNNFLAYVKQNGPTVVDALKSIGRFLGELGSSLAKIGPGELKAIAGFLDVVTKFAKQHPALAEAAVAMLTMSKAVSALKVASAGASLIRLLKLLLDLKGGKPFPIPGLPKPSSLPKTGPEFGPGALGEDAGAAGAASLLGPALLFGGPIIAGIIAQILGHSAPNVPFDPSKPNGPKIPKPGTLAGPAEAAQVTIAARQVTLNNHGPNPTPHGPGDSTNSTLADSRKIPLKVLISGDAVAAQKLLRIQKSVGGIPKNKDIRIGTPGVAAVQGGLANVILATHHMPPEKVIKVSSPGGNFTALTMLNISRAARGLPPTKKINVSSPGVTGALSDINHLGHSMGLLPKKKSVATSAPGAAATILQMINLDRKAHGLPPLKRIPTSAPGADKAVQQYIALARRAELIPPRKTINTSTPGAVKAYNQIDTLLHKTDVLPKDKHIPTDVPGAQHSILQYIDLYEKAHHLPISKKIPTSAPGGDHTIQQMIDLARKIGVIPAKKSIPTSAPGADHVKSQLSDVQKQINSLPRSKRINIDASGTVSFAGTTIKARAEGGLMTGPGGPRDDKILTLLSNREFVQPAHIVEAEGPDKMELLRQGKATIVPKLADGGFPTNIIATVKSEHLDQIANVDQWFYSNVGKKAISALNSLLSSFGGGGGGGSGQWIGVVREALTLLHQSTALAGLFLRVIAGESGGNPSAINLYDSNARAGHPSVGLAQVIRGTFDAFAGPFRNVGPFLAGVSINPLANVYAGLNYGIQTYGSVAGIPGIASELHGGGYRPYARGGFAFGGVPIKVGERGSEIFTPATDGYITPHNETGGPVSIRVFIGNEEIHNIARVEVDRNAVAAGRSIAAGRRIVR